MTKSSHFDISTPIQESEVHLMQFLWKCCLLCPSQWFKAPVANICNRDLVPQNHFTEQTTPSFQWGTLLDAVFLCSLDVGLVGQVTLFNVAAGYIFKSWESLDSTSTNVKMQLLSNKVLPGPIFHVTLPMFFGYACSITTTTKVLFMTCLSFSHLYFLFVIFGAA